MHRVLGRTAVFAAVVGGLMVSSAPARAECPAIVGDVTGNGLLTVADVQCNIIGTLWLLAGGEDELPSCALGTSWLDVNCDGNISVSDVTTTTLLTLGAQLPTAVDSNADQCPDACVAATAVPYEKSVARMWNEVLLDAIRVDTPRPTVHARNLFHLSVVMWDAWAAYDPAVDGWLSNEVGTAAPEAIQAAREEAISYAAYRILVHRFTPSVGAMTSLPTFDALMAALGYDPAVTTTTGDSPAAIGNRIGEATIAFGMSDGANEANDYENNSAYFSVNPPLAVSSPGITINDPNRWQTLALESFVTQNGIELGEVPEFVGPHWGAVVPFAIFKGEDEIIHVDPGPPPLLGGIGDAEYRAANIEVIEFSSYLDPDDGVIADYSPGGVGNNSLGINDGIGHPINPWTAEPYTPYFRKRGDYGRVLAEFWADGPDSETPPGHWNTIANAVTDDPLLVRRVRGLGPVLEPLEWDVKLYLALNGAVHDAAIAAWDAKSYYDYVRPISSIRYLCQFGQNTDPSLDSYSVWGMPLVDGLVEVITPESVMPGERHAHLTEWVGEIAIWAWQGEPEDPETEYSGVDWIPCITWVPYQRPSFVTPPFAGYVSGHSTFSRAAAVTMSELTGSPFFPGGFGQFEFEAFDYLEFEIGPTEPVAVQFATYFDASDQSGISRIYGGIHVRADDKYGRIMGAEVGEITFKKFLEFVTAEE